jgi:hypothetical protein
MHLESPPYQYVEVLLNWEWLSLRRILGFGRRVRGVENNPLRPSGTSPKCDRVDTLVNRNVHVAFGGGR